MLAGCVGRAGAPRTHVRPIARLPMQGRALPPAPACRAVARRRLAAPRAAESGGAAEPFQPSRPFHKGVVDPPEPEERPILGLTFSDVYYYLNIAYWSLLLVSVLTGGDLVSRIVHFENYTTAMFVSSLLFTLYHTVKFFRDLRQQLKPEARRDWRQMLRYGWNAVFWAAFVLWYAAPPVAAVADYTGTPGAVMCLYGAALALVAAIHSGHFGFMGTPQVPRRLHTHGVYALLRHPQALGNMLFLIGFSLAGGAVWASATFLLAFLLYRGTVVPAEERMLREAYGDQYEQYARRVPRFAWAIVLLVLLELLMLWRFQPWAVPIDATPPPVA